MRKTRAFLFLLFITLCHAPVLAVETAPHISDREIIENLSDLRGDIKELKAGQKALEQRFDEVNKRFDDMNDSVNRRFDDVNRRFDDVNKRFDNLQESTNNRFDDINGRFDILQWMFGLFITVAISLMGVMGRLLWNQQKKMTSMETSLETQKDELSFLKTLIEKLLPPRGVL